MMYLCLQTISSIVGWSGEFGQGTPRGAGKMASIAAEGVTIQLKPGKHYRLIKGLIEEFIPHFMPGSRVLYAGDTCEKLGYCDQEALRTLGAEIDVHAKMPDVVLHYPVKNWLLLVETVTSHGPIDRKRRGELASQFNSCSAGLLYLSAFNTRTQMLRYVEEISWETDVWLAEAPTHMIHFNGERLLGPY